MGCLDTFYRHITKGFFMGRPKNAGKAIKMSRIGKSSDFISECGEYKICAANDVAYGYLPMIKAPAKDKSVTVFHSLADDFVLFEEALDILNKQ